MNRVPVILETAVAADRRLRLIFDWRHDRFGHTVELVAGGQIVRLLASAEGTHRDGWPLSPPLQQLHVENRDSGHRVALLVGMAGTDHWSMSVETAPERDIPCLSFDVACRVTSGATPLRSVYQFAASSADVEIAHSVCRNPQLGWQLKPILVGKEITARLESIPDGVAIIPVAKSGPTVRWKYCIELFG